jgi:hypothetical protein
MAPDALDLAKDRIAFLRAKRRQPARIARFVLQQLTVHGFPIEQLNLTRIELDAVDRAKARFLGLKKGDPVPKLRDLLGE